MRKNNFFYKLIILILLFAFITGMVPCNILAAVKCKSVNININNITLAVGEVIPLTAVVKPLNTTEKQKWSSSNKKVAIVNQYGAVSALAEGTSKITVKVGKKKSFCNVTVVNTNPDDSIKQQLINYATKNDVYTKEEVDKLVSEKVKEISKDNANIDLSGYVTKKEVLTKEDVYKLIDEKIVSEGLGTDWEDGTELVLDNPESLPYYVACSYDYFKDTFANIESISVKKFHNTNITYNRCGKYNYIINVKGQINYSVSSSSDYDGSIPSCIVHLKAFSSSGNAVEWFDELTLGDFNNRIETDENGNFSYDYKIDGVFNDCDRVRINSIQWGYY